MPERTPKAESRVVVFSTQKTWGGGEEQLRLLITLLPQEGWGVYTLAPVASRLAEEIKRRGGSVIEVPGRGRNPRAWWSLRNLVRQWRPCVLFMNDPHAILHGLLATVGQKIIRVGARRTVFPLRSGWVYRQGLDCVLCISQASAEACRKAGVPEERITVIYEGIDPGRIGAADAGRGRSELVRLATPAVEGERVRFLVHVGKLTAAKGQEDLLEAFSRVSARYPECVLVLVGEGELRPALESQIAARGLGGRVVLAGFRKDALDLVAAADLFVFPSRQEGLGGAVMEALALGVPVVASTAGGIPELFSPEILEAPFATLVPPGDVAALGRAIEGVLTAAEDHRRAWGKRTREYARQRFSAQRMVRETVTLFARLCDIPVPD